LVLPVGKLAMAQFMDYRSMEAHIGQQVQCTYGGHAFDAIPLPHPSGASPWPRIEPGKTLLHTALQLISAHPAMAGIKTRGIASRPNLLSEQFLL
jgi:uracil-DNA glycosylase